MITVNVTEPISNGFFSGADTCDVGSHMQANYGRLEKK